MLKVKHPPTFFGGWGIIFQPYYQGETKAKYGKTWPWQTWKIWTLHTRALCLFLTSEQSINLPKPKFCSWAKSSYQAGVSLWISRGWSGIIAMIFIPSWNNSSLKFSQFSSQAHLLSHPHRLLCSSTILISLLFLPARMATIGNIFSTVAHIFLMLGEKRDQMLLLASAETELVCFLRLVFCFPYQLRLNTSVSCFILLYHMCAFLQLVVWLFTWNHFVGFEQPRVLLIINPWIREAQILPLFPGPAVFAYLSTFTEYKKSICGAIWQSTWLLVLGSGLIWIIFISC